MADVPKQTVFFNPWRCNPAPESTCGTLINDACVVVTGVQELNKLECFKNNPLHSCLRQSELNIIAITGLCGLSQTIGDSGNCPDTPGTGILGSINMGCIKENNCNSPFDTIHAPTVYQEFENVYQGLCELNNRNIFDTPVDTLTLGCFDLGPCGTPVVTLSDLLNAMIVRSCACCGSGSGSVNESWKTIGSGGNFANGGAIPALGPGVTSNPSVPLQARKRGDGTIDFAGELTVDSPSNLFPVISVGTPMPAGFRPIRNFTYSIIGWVAGTQLVVGELIIQTTGNISIAFQTAISLTGTAVFPITINYPID